MPRSKSLAIILPHDRPTLILVPKRPTVFYFMNAPALTLVPIHPTRILLIERLALILVPQNPHDYFAY